MQNLLYKYSARMERLWSSVDLRGLCIGAAWVATMHYMRCCMTVFATAKHQLRQHLKAKTGHTTLGKYE